MHQHLRATLLALLLITSFVGTSALANDWPIWRGINRDGVSTETGLALPWSGNSPKIAWRKSLGVGVAAVAVVGERAYTMGNINDRDIVYCFDTKTGREIWTHRYECSLDARMFEGGPGATPTVDEGRVYTISHEGHLFCLDADSGRVIWSKHLVNDFKGRRARWGFSGSPAIEDNMLIVDVGAVGASTMAFDKTSGQTLWSAGNDEPGYSSPLVIDAPGQPGKRTVLVFKANAIVAKDAGNGRELWRFRWTTQHNVNASMPIVADGKMFLSTGYGYGAALLDITGNQPTEIWRNKEMRNQIASSVVIDGYVYGFDGQVGRSASLKCIELTTGKTMWEHKGLGAGTLIAADGKLLVLSEQGQFVVAPVSSQRFQSLAQAQLLNDRCWVPPVLSHGMLYLRSNKGELVVLDVK